MRILFALSGFNRYERGAEIALLSVANQLQRRGNMVTLIGSGRRRRDSELRFLRAPSISRDKFERFPSIPIFRTEYAYEEATFAPGLLWQYRPLDYDVTVTCSYPFTNWILRRPSLTGARPAHIFVTQNGDWPATSNHAEYRFFSCDGLVCTNPDYFERNKNRWKSTLIPNGIDFERFQNSSSSNFRDALNIPATAIVVLMVSALIPTKRVSTGIEIVSRVPGAHLIVAGDGPLRAAIDAQASAQLHGRFSRLTVSSDRMPALYRAADVFLHLSKEESFGNVFLEAMASGIPIVGHDSPRLRWVVGNKEHLGDTTNVEETTAMIIAAVDKDPQKTAERQRRAEQFSWSTVANMYQAFLSEVSTRRPSVTARMSAD